MNKLDAYGLAQGDRIELVYTNDPYTQLRPGSRGTVNGGDDFSVWVKWDDGSSLGLIREAGDEWRKVRSD